MRLGRNLTAPRLFVVTEVLLVHDIPSEEVSMIPLSPTVTNNPVELVKSSSLHGCTAELFAIESVF